MHCFVWGYELLEQFVFCGAQAKHFPLPFVFSLFSPCLFSMWDTQNYVTGMSRDVLATRWPGHFLRLKARILKAKKTGF